MRILLWNIAMTPSPPPHISTRESKERAPGIAKLMNKYDIVVINESFLYRNFLLQHVSHQYHYTDPRIWYKPFNSGVVILSKIELFDCSFHHYSKAAIWDWFTSKALVNCKFRINDITFELYGTHLQAGNGNSQHAARLEQTKEIVARIREIHDPENEIIVCGDFNCGPVYGDHYSGHYSSFDDAKKRNEQYKVMTDFGLIPILERPDEDDISSFLFKPSLKNSGFIIERVEVKSDLSDTGPLAINIRCGNADL